MINQTPYRAKIEGKTLADFADRFTLAKLIGRNIDDINERLVEFANDIKEYPANAMHRSGQAFEHAARIFVLGCLEYTLLEILVKHVDLKEIQTALAEGLQYYDRYAVREMARGLAASSSNEASNLYEREIGKAWANFWTESGSVRRQWIETINSLERDMNPAKKAAS